MKLFVESKCSSDDLTGRNRAIFSLGLNEAPSGLLKAEWLSKSIASAAAFLILAWHPLMATTVISFEDISTDPHGYKAVDYQYSANSGIIFKDAVCVDASVYGGAGLPRSGTKYIEACFGVEFCSIPLEMDFRSDQSRIKVWVGYEGAMRSQQTVILRAYNGTSVQVGQTTASMAINSAVTPIRIPLEVTAAGIRKVTVAFLGSEGTLPSMFNNNLAIDDVEFDGNAPPPCSGNPVVTITSPANGLQTDASQITLQGTITGNNIPAQCDVTVTALKLPPHDFTPPFVYSVPLSGSGNSFTFSVPINLKLGDQNITVTIRNDCGYPGQATARVTNLPGKILWRYNYEQMHDELQYMVNIGCPIAVYTHSAIAVADPGTDITAGRDIPSHPCGTYIIEEPIFSKWKDWVSKGYHDDPPDFCPRNDRQSLPATPGNAWQYQDFGSGRIYVNWVSGGIANGPYFVPRVFVDAIEALGGVDVTGLPVSDPLECWTAHTWLFQQFARTPNIASSSFLSTLEIKGEPPVLYLERQGGNLIALKGAGIGLPSITPTICESRPCLGHHGPCDLTPPHYTSRLLSSQVESICHGTTFALRPADVREWEPVNGDCTTTTAVGFLTESHLSDQDLSTSHHHHYNPSGLITSDWCYDIIPLANFNYVLANNDKLEIEIEAGDLGYFSYDSIGVGLQKGALLQASGRWIIDCGHDDYSSEIHPPGLLAYTRTGTLPWTTSPATLTTISVNGYWNKLPVSVDIRPPPRPAPNAFLRLFKPVDSEAGWGLTTTWEFDPDSFSFVRVSFSSANPPICTVDTSYSGQVWPIPTQEYYGIWYLGWQLDSAYTVSSYDY